MTGRILNEYLKKCNDGRTLIIIRGDIPLFNKEYYDFSIEDWHNILKKDNIYGIECIDMDKDIQEQLNYIKEYIETTDKIVGIKLYPGYQHFYPTDEVCEPIYEFAEKHKLVVVFHNGDVWDDKNYALLKYAKACHIDEVAVRHPNVRFTLSHLGFPDILETAMIVNKNPNVYTCISGIIDTNYEKTDFDSDLKNAISYYPNLINKLMHGTDFCGEHTLLNQINEYEKFLINNFDEKDRRKVLYENAYNWYLEK
jgi:predicted TIM-barrel fold metal-dependent hydrolase